MSSWRILLVDDDADVHAITNLVLKNKSWRNRRFELRSVYNKRDAIDVLREEPSFHAAIVDVVMETETSGLELCDYIRQNCLNSTRIILRTGQPGMVPEDEILNEYDIDYYLAKSDVTPQKLFSVIRACVRSSQDISTLLAYGRQLQSFTKTLQDVTSVNDLIVFMEEALRFLELKHNCLTHFNYDLARPVEPMPEELESSGGCGAVAARSAIELSHQRRLALLEAHAGDQLGLPESAGVIPFEAHEDKTNAHELEDEGTLGGLVFQMEADNWSAKSKRDFVSDATLFIENWCIAYGTLRLRERLLQEQVLRDQMYRDRLESIATMVTGVAHELNTPLGVARTASSMIQESLEVVLHFPAGNREESDDLASDLHEACRLMGKNLDRAQRMIQSFRGLSASQLSDQRLEVDLKSIVTDCLETMLPDLKKSRVVGKVHSDNSELLWDGYPGHLSQVIINLIQNSLRYAYDPEIGGVIEVFISKWPDGNGFRIEFVDYGRGVDDHIKPRMFEAFVTSGRDKGGTGLGLGIVQNIMVNLLGGNVVCESESGSGTRFILDLPAVCKKEN